MKIIVGKDNILLDSCISIQNPDLYLGLNTDYLHRQEIRNYAKILCILPVLT